MISANYIDPHKFRPTGSRVLVKVLPKRTMSHGIHGPAIHLGAERESLVCEVIAVGPGRWRGGRPDDMGVKVGDRGRIGAFNGVVLNTEPTDDGYEYRILEQWKEAFGWDAPDLYLVESE